MVQSIRVGRSQAFLNGQGVDEKGRGKGGKWRLNGNVGEQKKIRKDKEGRNCRPRLTVNRRVTD